MSGSLYNTEVYRCTSCHEAVALAPSGFVISEAELQAKLDDHLKTCSGEDERQDAE